MEHRISKARDKWIDDFKNNWDDKINKIVSEKDCSIGEIDRIREERIISLKKYRDQQLEDIQIEFSNNVKELENEISNEKNIIEKEYSRKLSYFLTSNLNKPTIYDSICSFILYFKPSKQHTLENNPIDDLYVLPSKDNIVIEYNTNNNDIRHNEETPNGPVQSDSILLNIPDRKKITATEPT